VGSMDMLEYLSFEIAKMIFWVMAISGSLITVAIFGGV